MTRKKGKFVTTQQERRGILSSSRLQKWNNNTPVDLTDSVAEEEAEPYFFFPEVSDTVEVEAASLEGNKLQSWKNGRRIVDLGHIIEQLRCCRHCENALNLINIKKETRYGYGSVLSVQCSCGTMNNIDTNTRHKQGKSRGPRTFVINTKAALGMIHAGVGHLHVTNFMAAIGVRGLHHKRMKRLQSEVGEHVRFIAKQSCRSALREEKCKIKKQSSSDTSRRDVECQSAPCPDVTSNMSDALETSISIDQSTQGIHQSTDVQSSLLNLDHSYASSCLESLSVSGEFKYDMGWQKRGSGRCYDSRSGVGTMIGNRTGKICAYGIRLKDCKFCNYHGNKCNIPPDHQCVKNWNGSAKAMEPDVGASLVKEIEKEDVKVGVIIMDDDCTTMARIRQELSHEIVKWSDINHTVKHLGNSLYTLQKKHKVLSTMVIKHIQKCFNYALAQNQGNVEQFQQSLKQITPHLFGEHDSCGEWCRYIQDPEHYKHNGLPHGRPLTGVILRSDLESILHVFIKNAEKIAPRGSTKEVESFNNMIAAKAPKRIHYSASASLINRVDCAVAQKNLGMSYLNEVNLSLGLSPGRVFADLAQKQDTLRKRRNDIENTLTFKRRRLERKFAYKKHNAAKELREGPTYKSGVATSHISNITEIPNPRVQPAPEHLSEETFTNSKKIFCDIETSSLSYDADIVQIAAICGEDKFNQYIMPSKNIVPAASAVTGLSTNGHVLLYKCKPVATLPLKEALQVFLAWLEKHVHCVLIGHNFKRFDFPRIVRAFEIVRLTNPFKQYVTGIIDTYLLFKILYPDLHNYSQEFLVSIYLKESYAAHNALGDVEILQKLCTTVGILDNQMLISSYSTQYSMKLWHYNKDGKQNLQSLMILKDQNVLSKGMIDKIAKSGLCLGHLKLAVSRSGLVGLQQLCKEIVNGKPRVTSMTKIITKLFDYLKD